MDTGFANLSYLEYMVPTSELCRTYWLLGGQTANAIMPVEGHCPREVLF